MTGSPVHDQLVPPPGCDELALRIVGTEHDGRILRIRAAKCIIGSARGCTLRLRAPGVQGVHCLILRGPGGLAARSWSAETWLNGRAFTDARLNMGDRLTVGPLEFEVVDPVQRPDAPTQMPVEHDRLSEPADDSAAIALAERLAEREAHIARLSARLAEAEQLIEQAEREPAAAEQAPSQESAAEIASLKQQLDALTVERDGWRREQRQLQERILDEQQRAETAAKALEQAQATAHEQAAAWERERAQLAAGAQRAHLQGSATLDNRRELREMEVALTHWREKAQDHTREIGELRQQVADLLEAKKAFDEQRALRIDLEEAARDLDAETERLLAQEEELQQRTQAWEAERAQLVGELDAKQRRLDELQTSLEDRCLELEQQAAALAARWEELEAAEQVQQRRALAAVPTAEEQPQIDDEAAPEAPFEPTSASEIIARLSASGLWKDDVPPEEPVASVPEPAWKSLVPENSPSAAETATPAAPEEEDSIEAYMQRLLQRVSGDGDTTQRRPAPAPEPTPVAAAEGDIPDADQAPPPAVAEEPFDPSTYVPRSTAPELTANLAAMRKLANSSARTAIDTSSKRRQAKRASGKLVMSVVALVAGSGLLWLSMRTQSVLSYYAALAAGAAALLCSLHAAYLWLKAPRQDVFESQDEQD